MPGGVLHEEVEVPPPPTARQVSGLRRQVNGRIAARRSTRGCSRRAYAAGGDGALASVQPSTSSDFRASKTVDWTVSHVAAWLCSIELVEHSDSFIAASIDGELLLVRSIRSHWYPGPTTGRSRALNGISNMLA